MPTNNNSARHVVLGLSSGQRLTVSAVMLYPELDVRKVSLLRAKAQDRLGGFSAKPGLWSVPSWVFGSAIDGDADSPISNPNTKEDMDLMKEVALGVERLKAKCNYFNVHEITGIQRSSPSAWRAEKMSDVSIDLGRLELTDRARVMKQYGIKREHIAKGTSFAQVRAPAGFIHDEDEFVWIAVEEAHIAVRWTDVVTYQVVNP